LVKEVEEASLNLEEAAIAILEKVAKMVMEDPMV